LWFDISKNSVLFMRGGGRGFMIVRRVHVWVRVFFLSECRFLLFNGWWFEGLSFDSGLKVDSRFSEAMLKRLKV
jgi:hypothetical protein